MTDDEAVIPLGRRLEALARVRLRAWEPRPAWVGPLTVALRRSMEVADILGERFERTERPPWLAAQLPVPPTDGRATPRFVPRTMARSEGPDRPAQRPEPPDAELRPLPADVRSRLRREVGRATDVMRVHDGPHADARARAAGADAVTVGRDVYLRHGRWAPRREEGVALLAHEATHVAALVDPGHAWRGAIGPDAEEALARARERSLL
ncbi:DUF4157 domain-containing protein, partial [Frankia sp. CiP3]|uniref:eCIS core domain-containing protein n=1 Tax=Frankia sp. CiP3 TaxID=2880971 RepID=UPI001EF5163A